MALRLRECGEQGRVQAGGLPAVLLFSLALGSANAVVDATAAPESAAVWDFSSPAGYLFDPERIEFAEGAAALKSVAGWLDPASPYRRPVTIGNPASDPCISCQYEVALDRRGFDLSLAGPRGEAFRFASGENEAWLPHWVEAFDDSSRSALLTFALPGVAGLGTGAAYLYYGDRAAATASTWVDTFRSGPPEPPSTSVFSGAQYNAFPSLERLPDGEILCAFRAGRAHMSHDGRIVLGRSSDGGLTWTSSVAFDRPGVDDRVDLGLTCLADGTLLLPLYQHDGRTVTGCFVLRSTSRGIAWEDTIAIRTGSVAAAWRWLATYGRILEQEDGTLLMPVYGARTGEIVTQSALLQSVDRGFTWTTKSIVTPIALAFNETSVIDLGGGRLLAAVRCEWVVPQIYQVTSSDGGETWSEPVQLFDGVSPSLTRLDSGNVLLATADRVGIAGIRLSLSRDEGDTWPASVLVDPEHFFDDLGYPSCLSLPDGSVLLVHYRHPEGIRGTVLSEAFVGWNPNFHNSFEGFEDPQSISNWKIWRLSGTPSLVGRSPRGRTGDHALFLADPTTEARPSAVRTLYAFGRPNGTVSFWILPQALAAGAEFGLLSGSDALDAMTRFWFRIMPDGAIAHRVKLGASPCATWRNLTGPGAVALGTWSKISIRFRALENDALLLVNGVPAGTVDACYPEGAITHFGLFVGSRDTADDSILIDDLYTGQFAAAAESARLGIEERLYGVDDPWIVTPPHDLSDAVVLDSFAEIAVKDGGEILYQLSSDGGVTWLFWNGDEWAAALALEQANTADVVDANLRDFPLADGDVALRVFMHSEGVRGIRLEQVEIGYTPSAIATPEAFFVGRAYPNPTSSVAAITCGLPEPAMVVFRIHDPGGRQVRALTVGPLPAGYHRVAWDGKDAGGRDAAAGVYFYEIEAGGERRNGRVVLLR